MRGLFLFLLISSASNAQDLEFPRCSRLLSPMHSGTQINLPTAIDTIVANIKVYGRAPSAKLLRENEKMIFQDLKNRLPGWKASLKLKGSNVDSRALGFWTGFNEGHPFEKRPLDSEFNRHLRESLPMRQSVTQIFKRFYRNLERIPSVNSLSFRGITSTFKGNVGDIFVDNGFMPSTIDIVRAYNFWTDERNGTFFVLNGHSGKFLPPFLNDQSIFRTEFEVLFMPGSQWRITRIIEPRSSDERLTVFMEEL